MKSPCMLRSPEPHRCLCLRLFSFPTLHLPDSLDAAAALTSEMTQFCCVFANCRSCSTVASILQVHSSLDVLQSHIAYKDLVSQRPQSERTYCSPSNPLSHGTAHDVSRFGNGLKEERAILRDSHQSSGQHIVGKPGEDRSFQTDKRQIFIPRDEGKLRRSGEPVNVKVVHSRRFPHQTVKLRQICSAATCFRNCFASIYRDTTSMNSASELWLIARTISTMGCGSGSFS